MPSIGSAESYFFYCEDLYNDDNADIVDNYNKDDIDDGYYDDSDNSSIHQIKYVEAEQKLMVTVERCEGLKKESGVFGGSCDDDWNENDAYHEDSTEQHFSR